VNRQCPGRLRRPRWYGNASNVHILGTNPREIHAHSHFRWRTFCFPTESIVTNYIPNREIGWSAGDDRFRAFHSWLLIPNADGCLVVTEETQMGPNAIKFNTEQPHAMYDGHDWWISALKVRSERMAQQARGSQTSSH
jgi:hypothetical protein